MNIYVLVLLLMTSFIGVFYLVEHKLPSSYRPLPIVIHLLSCCIIIPIFLFSLNFSGFSIPTISLGSGLSSINQTISAILLALILIELSSVKPNKKIVKLASFSSIIPAIGALGFAAIFGYLSNLTFVISLICLFSFSAVPVLYIYLKQMNYNNETITTFMGAAILIDLVAWLVFNLITTSFNPIVFVLSILLGFIPYVVHKFAKGDRQLWLSVQSVLFFLIFTSLFYIKSYALVFAILFLVNLQKYYPEGFRSFPQHWIFNFFNYAAIPLLFILASLSISWDTLNFQISWLEFSALILMPIVFKFGGSLIGLKSINYNGDKVLGSLLLNTRGLTEIVFINTLFMLNIISPSIYIALLIMTLFATLMPGLVLKYQMRNTLKKAIHLKVIK